MFITAVCVIFLIKLRWPKNKSLYDMFVVLLLLFTQDVQDVHTTNVTTQRPSVLFQDESNFEERLKTGGGYRKTLVA